MSEVFNILLYHLGTDKYEESAKQAFQVMTSVATGDSNSSLSENLKVHFLSMSEFINKSLESTLCPLGEKRIYLVAFSRLLQLLDTHTLSNIRPKVISTLSFVMEKIKVTNHSKKIFIIIFKFQVEIN
jgi:hypothetical protein